MYTYTHTYMYMYVHTHYIFMMLALSKKNIHSVHLCMHAYIHTCICICLHVYDANALPFCIKNIKQISAYRDIIAIPQFFNCKKTRQTAVNAPEACCGVMCVLLRLPQLLTLALL